MALIWPKANWLDLMCGCKQVDAVAHLTRRLSTCSVMEERDAPDWQQCKQIAELIIEKHAEMELDGQFLVALTKIGDFELVQKFVQRISKTRWRNDEVKERQFYAAFEVCVAQFGWDPMHPLIEHVLYSKFS